MIDIDFNKDTGIFGIHYQGEEPISYQFWARDLNTNLVCFGWFTSFSGKGISNWQAPLELINASYISGFEINGFSNNELVLTKQFQHKKTNSEFKFTCPPDELSFGSWESLVYGDEYKVDLKETDVIYDLGANFGVYTMYALSQNVKQVYAFEPTPKNINCLRKTFEWDKNVQIVEKAISNKTEIQTFYLHSHSVGNSLNNITETSIDVECINLEQWVKETNSLPPTVVKCDIEGAEYDFIDSLTDEFFNTINTFILEYHYSDSIKVWPLIKRFLNLGYTLRLVNKNALEGNMGTFIAERNWKL